MTARSALGELAFQHDFNGPDLAWVLHDSDNSARILSQECVPGGASDRQGSERIVTAAAAGHSVFLRCPTVRIAVLPELQIRLWASGERPSVQLAARIVLPRSLDPRSGAPTTVIVRGDATNQAGHWQQLVLSDVPKLLSAQVRVRRAAPGVSIDAGEAYVDSIVLIVPGDPRGVEVFTDDLEVDGIVLPQPEEIDLASFPSADESPAAAGSSAASVRLQGGLLLVDDRPFLPRVIEWQGEPFALLAERGFNAVFLKTAPSDEHVAGAQRHGLWFVCIPPRPETIMRDGIGRAGDRILAWHLDDLSSEEDSRYAYRWAEVIRRHDAVAGRPVIIAPQSDWAIASKAADVLAAGHPLGERVSAAAYEQWQQRRRSSVRHGTPLWSTIATQFGPAAREQAAALSGAAQVPPAVDLDELEAKTHIDCRLGVRGFIFRSESSLAESDAATRQRAAALELINRRLRLIEPWLAGGKVIGRITSADASWQGVVWHVDRARLLMPLPVTSSSEQGEAASLTSQAKSEIAFLVPGAPASSQAYELSPAAMRSLPLQRVAGGTRLVLPASRDTFALITEDPQVIQTFRRCVARDGPQTMRLLRNFIALRAERLDETARRLHEIGYDSEAAVRAVALVNEQLRQLDGQVAAGRLEPAWEMAGSANRVLRLAAAEQRRRLGTSAAFHSNPLAPSYDLLAEYAAFQRTVAALSSGENLLYAGDFEDLQQASQSGWRHLQDSRPGVESRAELSPAQPKHGQYCLTLQGMLRGTAPRASAVDGPFLWIVSPPMPVDPGQIIEITGWVRIDEPLGGDGPGLQIVDSLGGPELAIAVRETSGWQPFQILRAAAESTELRLTFALSGIGSARIDAVMVRPLHGPVAQRLPPVAAPR